DAYPGEIFKGRIARVAPVLDPSTRTASMEVEISNADNRLKPGMYARVELMIERREGVTLVPKAAVVDYEGRRGVWTTDENNKIRFLAVALGLENADNVEILQGLNPGDRIVTDGAASLRAGDTVVLPGQPPGAPGGAGGRGPGRPGAQAGSRGQAGGGQPRGPGERGAGGPGGERGQRPQ
ncbi:MAG: efflux RND transporter periplasmic adaptor subunit, partial [Acidobacteriota bacterium]|nr:efflux RND transporter periplasmic adaptor subunit [Acidobacteriota bacterium]